MTTTASKRYTVEAPTWGGTYNERFGWHVVDTTMERPFHYVTNGSEKDCTRWATQWNRNDPRAR